MSVTHMPGMVISCLRPLNTFGWWIWTIGFGIVRGKIGRVMEVKGRNTGNLEAHEMQTASYTSADR